MKNLDLSLPLTRPPQPSDDDEMDPFGWGGDLDEGHWGRKEYGDNAAVKKEKCPQIEDLINYRERRER